MIKLLTDIYFDPLYYQIFERLEDASYHCFSYKKNDYCAIYPFLKSSVNKIGYDLKDQYYDIQGAYGYNGVISNTKDHEFINAFYKSFSQYCLENNIIAEFTRFHPLLDNYEFSQNHMQVQFDRSTVALDLEKSYDEIWNSEYSSTNRNMIRKAEKLGYTCEILWKPLKEYIDKFIDIYLGTMRVVGAEPYYLFDKAFFYDTFDLLADYTYLFNIRNNVGQLHCTAIIFKYNGFLHYHLSGRINESANCVNNYLLDQVVKFGKESGCKLLHLGGGRSSSPDDSLLKFKMNFSKTIKHFYIGKKIHNQAVYDEVVKQWGAKFPYKKEKYNNYLLKYRY